MSFEEIVALAERLAAASVAGEKAELERARKQREADTLNQQNRVRDVSLALGDMLKGGSERLAGLTGDVVGAIGGLGAGFSGSMQAGFQAGMDAVNGQLTQFGQAPLGPEVGAPADFADVTHGLGAVIPGGEAATAAMADIGTLSKYPKYVADQGLRDVVGVGLEGQKALDELDAQGRDLREKQRGLSLETLMKLQEFELSKGAQRTNTRYIEAQVAQIIAGLTGEYAGQLTPEARKLVAEITGKDPVTGNPVADGEAGVVDTALSKEIGWLVDKYGKPILKNGKKQYLTPDAKKTDDRKAAVRRRDDAVAEVKTELISLGRSARGAPRENPDPVIYGPGAYLGKNGKGTNDPAKAQRKDAREWNDVFNEALAIATANLRRYGLKPAAIEQIVRSALIAGGMVEPTKRRPDLGKPRGG